MRSKLGFVCPILEPEYTSSMIIDAIKRKQAVLAMPRAIYVSHALHFFLPTTLRDMLTECTGLNSAMDSFKQTR
jgi:hypothetical protein